MSINSGKEVSWMLKVREMWRGIRKEGGGGETYISSQPLGVNARNNTDSPAVASRDIIRSCRSFSLRKHTSCRSWAGRAIAAWHAAFAPVWMGRREDCFYILPKNCWLVSQKSHGNSRYVVKAGRKAR